MAIFSELLPFFGIYESFFDESPPIFELLFLSLIPSPTSSLPTPSLSDFRSGVAGCFLLVFFIIVSSVSIIVTTVNNNIYNYSYKYKKKHKFLNQISNLKKKNKTKDHPTKKKKQNQSYFRPNTSIDLLCDIFAWNNRTKKTK